jgi:hypothetical protein
MSIRPLPSISISCIETLDYDKAAKALRQTLRVCKDLPIKKVYWLSDSQCPSQQDLKAEWGKDFVQWIPIPAFDLGKSFNRQLEKLTLDLLPKTVDTDFNLIIQADGYAVNADAWTDEFYEYDYIGAPWPWEIPGRDVGNGGFSWRSKKLYQAILDLRSKHSFISLISQLPTIEVIEDKFQGYFVPEDNLICNLYRPLLEQEYGIRFAPAELADQFSVETNGNTPWLGKSFGFHGRMTGSFYIHSDKA